MLPYVIPATLFIIAVFSFTGCASSNVSRETAANVDMGVQNAKNLASDATSGDMAESYQNASQSAKGGLLGGTAGAVTGTMASGVGFLPGAAVGAILGASYGAYIDSNSTLHDKLENRGIYVVELGDQVMLVIPSARIFEPMTSDIMPQGYSTLDLVAQYVNSYQKMLVKVNVYTDKLNSNDVDLALSEQQAQKVGKYLQKAGLDARVLYASGRGSERLIMPMGGEWGTTDNYRIEVTLEKLPA